MFPSDFEKPVRPAPDAEGGEGREGVIPAEQVALAEP